MISILVGSADSRLRNPPRFKVDFRPFHRHNNLQAEFTLLLSMTGHGQARAANDAVSVSCEARSVNNRFLKVTVSCADRFAELENQAKSIVQSKIRRGSIHLQIDIQWREQPMRYRINAGVLRSYHEQMRSIDSGVGIERLVDLPGVVEEIPLPAGGPNGQSDQDWSVIQSAIESAIDKMIEMRVAEGKSMSEDLIANCRQIREQLTRIEQRSPQVVKDYSRRLTERINQLLAEFDVTVTAADFVREVGVFAEKGDISEETVRLQTHLDQFFEIVNSSQSDGRKLEFVTQEMLRETNTIGSKANDAEIAQSVVDIKSAIERIREMTQNIE